MYFFLIFISSTLRFLEVRPLRCQMSDKKRAKIGCPVGLFPKMPTVL